MLGAMFTGRLPLARDGRGRCFIDRDGRVFRHVLNFLRSDTLDLPRGFGELALLRREADFYQIRPLMEALGRLEVGATGGALLSAEVDRQARTLHFNLKRAPETYELCACAVTVFSARLFCTSAPFLQLLCRRLSYRGRDGAAPPQPDPGRPPRLRLEWTPRPDELPPEQYGKQRYRELSAVDPLGGPPRDVPDTSALLEELLALALAEGFRLDAVSPVDAAVLDACSLRLVRH
ncbi:KCD21 protein, partial [Amia calva]|nr:KCD21 protein [Amia calva]